MHGVRLTAASQPAEKDIVVADAVRVDEQEHLLRLLVAARGCLGLRIVEVEHIVIEVVALWGGGRDGQPTPPAAAPAPAPAPAAAAASLVVSTLMELR